MQVIKDQLPFIMQLTIDDFKAYFKLGFDDGIVIFFNITNANQPKIPVALYHYFDQHRN